MHSQNIRVICWATSLVNTDSPNYNEGLKKGYYLDDGATVKWWHGHGSFIDYSNPEALKWWHSQLDLVLDIGLDGFKCDGTDPFLYLLGGIAKGYGGFITEREYANYYYRDFFYYSQSKNPEALIMARPMDSYDDILFLEFAPHDVMYSGWVGDQDPTFEGLQNALLNMFHSAWNGYLNFGSDIGGYRSNSAGRTKELLIRWAQLGAFCPLMENGGEGVHVPWGFDEETVDIYRKFVNIHMELTSYFLSNGAERYIRGISQMTPLNDWTLLKPDNWGFKMGDDIFVTPIIENSTTVSVTFPSHDEWVNWWDNSTYQPGTTTTLTVGLDRFPVFKRKGSIIPLNVVTEDSSHGSASSGDSITLLIHLSDKIRSSVRDIYEWKASGMTVNYTFSPEEKTFTLTATAHTKPVIILLRGIHLSQNSILYNEISQEKVSPMIHSSDLKDCLSNLRTDGVGFCHGDPTLHEIHIRPGSNKFGTVLTITDISVVV